MKKIKKITNKELERRIQGVEENDVSDIEIYEIDEGEERVYYSCKVYHDQIGNYEYFNECYVSFESLKITEEDIQHLL